MKVPSPLGLLLGGSDPERIGAVPTPHYVVLLALTITLGVPR